MRRWMLASECRGRPLDLKWIDTDKGGGDPAKTKLRSRLVCRDIKARKGPVDTLAGSDLFSATPPLEVVRALVSMMARTAERATLSPARWRSLKLLKSVYGLQEASHIWQSHWGRVLRSKGWVKGLANPACMHHKEEEEEEACGVVHGDDFLVLACQFAIDGTGRLL
eukprot:154788-Amphidinium_carterae.1